ncbi:MAG: DUF308 domain-containing protein [Sphaerochaetaceae bacterium]
MNKKGGWIIHLIVAILIIVLGIFILVRKDLFKQVFVIAIGIILLFASIRTLVTMTKYPLSKFNRNSTLTKGILGIIISILAIIMPIAIGATVWRVLLIIVAIQLALAAIVLIVDAIALKSAGLPLLPLVIEAAASLVVSVALFAFPQSVADLLVTILGVAVIIIGIAAALIAYFSRKKGPVVEVEVY